MASCCSHVVISQLHTVQVGKKAAWAMVTVIPIARNNISTSSKLSNSASSKSHKPHSFTKIIQIFSSYSYHQPRHFGRVVKAID